MFTGIIRTMGRVVSLTTRPPARLVVAARRLRGRRGDSVAVDGVCLTVARRQGGRLTFDLLGETLRVTTVGARRPGDLVNLEPALTLGDSVGGHWVLGHVDGVGRVVGRRQTPSGVLLAIAPPPALRRYLAPKGAVAVDGVSLTLGPKPPRGALAVHLVPVTLAETTLGRRRVGDRVNLEVDPMARYARHGHGRAIDGVRR